MRRTGGSVGRIRTGIELSVLAVGFALGGTVGLGTVVYALSIGPLLQLLLPAFTIRYAPDARQQIAASWPHSIDDSQARADWGWQARIGLDAMVREMLEHIDAAVTQPA